MSKNRYSIAVLLSLVVIVILGVLAFWPSTGPASNEKRVGSKSEARERQGSGKREPAIADSTKSALGASQSSPARFILGDRGNLSGRQRISWIREHGKEFGEPEVKEIVDYLQSGEIPDGLSEGQWHWIVDELLTALRVETKNPGELTRQLEGIFSNSALDLVVRDYALQHLGHLGREGGDQEVIRAAAMAGLQEIGSPMAGTALLVLHNEPATLSGGTRAGNGGGTPPPDPAGDPGSLALTLLANERASLPSRVTALQVAAQRGTGGTVRAAAGVLESDAPVLLKIAAIAAVGEAGSPADLALLQSVSANSPQLQRAIRSATAKLIDAN